MRIIGPYDEKRHLVVPDQPDQLATEGLDEIQELRRKFFAPVMRLIFHPNDRLTLQFSRPGIRPSRSEVRQFRLSDAVTYYLDLNGHLWEMSARIFLSDERSLLRDWFGSPSTDAAEPKELMRNWIEALPDDTLPGLTRDLRSVIEELLTEGSQTNDVLLRVDSPTDYYRMVFSIERHAAAAIGTDFDETQECDDWLYYWRHDEVRRLVNWFNLNAHRVMDEGILPADRQSFIAEWSYLTGLKGVNEKYFEMLKEYLGKFKERQASRRIA